MTGMKRIEVLPHTEISPYSSGKRPRFANEGAHAIALSLSPSATPFAIIALMEEDTRTTEAAEPASAADSRADRR